MYFAVIVVTREDLSLLLFFFRLFLFSSSASSTRESKAAGTNCSRVPHESSIGSCRRTSMFIPVSPQWEPLAGTLRAKRHSLRRPDWKTNAWLISLFSLSISFFLSLSLARTLVLSGFRSWSWFADAPHRCSSRPSLVAPRGRSCPYSANPVVTGHPEELHQQEQFRVLVYHAMYFVLFVRVSKPPYIRPSINQCATYLLLNTSLNI